MHFCCTSVSGAWCNEFTRNAVAGAAAVNSTLQRHFGLLRANRGPALGSDPACATACTFSCPRQSCSPTTPSSGPAGGAGLLDQCRARGGALPIARVRRAANAAILSLYPSRLSRRAGSGNRFEGSSSQRSSARLKVLKRGQLTAPAPSFPKTKLIEDGRRREAHGHHRVGARTRGTAPALIIRRRRARPPRRAAAKPPGT